MFGKKYFYFELFWILIVLKSIENLLYTQEIGTEKKGPL
jgi:hypothetical protein